MGCVRIRIESRVMTMYRTLLAGVLAAVLSSAPAMAGPHGIRIRDGQQQEQFNPPQRAWPQRDADRAFLNSAVAPTG